LLTYNVESTVGGKMAQIGARLIDATAAQLAGQFFDKFAGELAPAGAAAAVTPGAGTGGAVTSSQSGGMPAWVWGVAGLVVLAALYFWFVRGH